MSAETIYVRGLAKTLEDSAEAWKLEHEQVRDVHFVEKLIPIFVGLVSFVEEQVRDSWQSYLESPGTYPAQAKGEELATGLDIVLSIVDAVDACITFSEGQGYVVEGAEDARAARHALTSMNERFLDGWPMLDVKEAEAAQARVDAGRYIALEDLARVLDDPVR